MSTGRTASILRRLEGRCEKELDAVAKLIVGFVRNMCLLHRTVNSCPFEVAMLMCYIPRCNVRVSVATYVVTSAETETRCKKKAHYPATW